MKQKLDEIRTLAIKLYEAGQKEKRKHPKQLGVANLAWRELSPTAIAVWDSVAICAYNELKRKNRGTS